jgi:hypothetical protein
MNAYLRGTRETQVTLNQRRYHSCARRYKCRTRSLDRVKTLKPVPGTLEPNTEHCFRQGKEVVANDGMRLPDVSVVTM